MIIRTCLYSLGGLLGFALAVLTLTATPGYPLLEWINANLGYSIWAFAMCLTCFFLTLNSLQSGLEGKPRQETITQLDQLSDIWIHVFVGIGVVWTAIGMRNALVNTLAEPEISGNAAQVLERLVDGGILLALSTTIVGAIGGYLMRIAKTLLLGSRLSQYYAEQESVRFESALDRLSRIEHLLEELTFDRRLA